MFRKSTCLIFGQRFPNASVCRNLRSFTEIQHFRITPRPSPSVFYRAFSKEIPNSAESFKNISERKRVQYLQITESCKRIDFPQQSLSLIEMIFTQSTKELEEEFGRTRTQRKVQIGCLVDDIITHNVKLNPCGLEKIIQSCITCSLLSDALKVLEYAIQNGVHLTNETVSTLFTAIDNAEAYSFKDLQQALESIEKEKIFRSFSRIKSWTYSAFLLLEPKKAKPSSSLDLFDFLSSFSSPKFQLRVYNKLLNDCADICDVEKAKKIHGYTNGNGNSRSLLVMYNTLIKVCLKASKMGDAFIYFEEMKEKGIGPDSITIATMLHTITRERHNHIDINTAKRVLSAIGGSAALLTVSSTSIDSVVASFGTHTASWAFVGLTGFMFLTTLFAPQGPLRSLQPNPGNRHNLGLLESFFVRLSEENHVDRGVYILHEMFKYNIQPSSTIYDSAAQLFIRKRHPSKAVQLILFPEKLRIPALADFEYPIRYSTTVELISALFAQELLVPAERIFELAMANNIFDDEMLFKSKDKYIYDLTIFRNNYKLIATVISYLMDDFSAKNHEKVPSLQFNFALPFPVLDQLDITNPTARNLFSIQAVKNSRTVRNVSQINVPSIQVERWLQNSKKNSSIGS